ncbi:MAG: FHA domain-containing protein [bacterium]
MHQNSEEEKMNLKTEPEQSILTNEFILNSPLVPAWEGKEPGLQQEDGKFLEFSIFEGKDFFRSERFSKGKIIVGKSEEADIILQGRNIFDIHAFFYRNGDQVFVSDGDLGSGVIVNGRFVSSRALNPHDLVFIGPYTIKVQLGKAYSQPSGDDFPDTNTVTVQAPEEDDSPVTEMDTDTVTTGEYSKNEPDGMQGIIRSLENEPDQVFHDYEKPDLTIPPDVMKEQVSPGIELSWHEEVDFSPTGEDLQIYSDGEYPDPEVQRIEGNNVPEEDDLSDFQFEPLFADPHPDSQHELQEKKNEPEDDSGSESYYDDAILLTFPRAEDNDQSHSEPVVLEVESHEDPRVPHILELDVSAQAEADILSQSKSNEVRLDVPNFPFLDEEGENSHHPHPTSPLKGEGKDGCPQQRWGTSESGPGTTIHSENQENPQEVLKRIIDQISNFSSTATDIPAIPQGERDRTFTHQEENDKYHEDTENHALEFSTQRVQEPGVSAGWTGIEDRIQPPGIGSEIDIPANQVNRENTSQGSDIEQVRTGIRSFFPKILSSIEMVKRKVQSLTCGHILHKKPDEAGDEDEEMEIEGREDFDQPPQLLASQSAGEEDDEEEEILPRIIFPIKESLMQYQQQETILDPGEVVLEVLKCRGDDVVDMCFLTRKEKYSSLNEFGRFYVAENKDQETFYFYFTDQFKGKIQFSDSYSIDIERLSIIEEVYRKKGRVYRCLLPMNGVVSLYDGSYDYYLRLVKPA